MMRMSKSGGPIAQIVCWNCKTSSNGDIQILSNGARTGKGKTLFRLRDKYGEKTPDYVCTDCKHLGHPPIGNVSFIKFPTPEELERMWAVLKDLKEGEHRELGAV